MFVPYYTVGNLFGQKFATLDKAEKAAIQCAAQYFREYVHSKPCLEIRYHTEDCEIIGKKVAEVQIKISCEIHRM